MSSTGGGKGTTRVGGVLHVKGVGKDRAHGVGVGRASRGTVKPPSPTVDPELAAILQSIGESPKPPAGGRWADEAADTIDTNPLLAEWQIATDGRQHWGSMSLERSHARNVGWGMQTKYAYSTPTEEALSMIEACGPVVEVGAGRGYWAKCLADRGVDVIATDVALPASGSNVCWGSDEVAGVDQYYPTVEMHGVQAADLYSDRALMMVWPDPETRMASDVLSNYRGDTLIYVGEDAGGCTGNQAFFDEVEDETKWTLRASAVLPPWPGTHDGITIYDRVR
jgi:hypothetical protein